MNNFKTKTRLILGLFLLPIIIFSCKDQDTFDLNSENSLNTKSTQGMTALSMARIHNDLMCKLFIEEGDYFKEIDPIEFLSKLNGDKILEYDFSFDMKELINSTAYELSHDISYEKVVYEVNKALDFLEGEGSISEDFKNLIRGIYVDRKELETPNFIKEKINLLTDYKSKHEKEEVLLQKFTLQLIYSGSLWEMYYGYDTDTINYISREDYIDLCDAAGAIIGGYAGGIAGGALGQFLLSKAARSDIENKRICLCWGSYEKECPCHGTKPKNAKSNIVDNIINGELRLLEEYNQMLSEFIENHPLIAL